MSLNGTPDISKGGIRCLWGVSIDRSLSLWAQVHDDECGVIRCQIQCAKYGLTIGMNNVRQHNYGSMKICNYELDHCNGHRTCKSLTSIKQDCRNSYKFNSSVSSLLRLKNWSYAEQALAYQISGEICTSYAGESGMLLHVYGKLEVAKLKSSCLSYNWVNGFLPASVFNKVSKYKAMIDDFEVSLISSSLGYM
jgi:hypothetical protein